MLIKQDLCEGRQGVRVPFQAYVEICPVGTDFKYDGKTIDVSVSGLIVDFALPGEFLQSDCILRIIFPGRHSNLTIERLEGMAVRIDSENKTTAFAFVEPFEWFLLFAVYQAKIEQLMENAKDKQSS